MFEYGSAVSAFALPKFSNSREKMLNHPLSKDLFGKQSGNALLLRIAHVSIQLEYGSAVCLKVNYGAPYQNLISENPILL